jgi:hypothetical protein
MKKRYEPGDWRLEGVEVEKRRRRRVGERGGVVSTGGATGDSRKKNKSNKNDKIEVKQLNERRRLFVSCVS